jgi:hypothetical protein
VDVLSHKAHCNYLPVVRLTREESSTRVLPNLYLFNIILTPTLRDEIKAAQKSDEDMGHIKRRMQEGDPNVACFCEDAERTLWFMKRLVVPRKEALKKKIIDEAHTLRYFIHPGSTKMYHDLRQQFWSTRMKREAARYVSECDTCRKVKTDYIKPRRLLQPLSILEWKWDDISMDFIVGLPLTARKFHSIWVIVDRLSKSSHFIPVHTRYDARRYAEIYIAHVLCLHGVLKMIIFDRVSEDDNLQSRFAVCRLLLGATARIPRDSLDPQFSLSLAEGGQIERVNQILEDILRACVLEHQGS